MRRPDRVKQRPASTVRTTKIAWMGRAAVAAMAAATGFVAATPAHAQNAETVLIAPWIPQGFDRGRNIGVLERQRPDYDALGVQVGSFIAYPKLDVGLGDTSNVFLTSENEKNSVFAAVAPSLRIGSDWQQNELVFRADGQFRRYVGNSRRNEDNFNLSALHRLDLGTLVSLTTEAQYAEQFETPFSGEVSSQLIALSKYRRSFLSERAQYASGRFRVIAAVDYNSFDFSNIDLGTTKISQGNRDRDITRVTGQLEYAFSPSMSVYGQAAIANTRYDDPLAPGVPNRDSNGFRAIAGINFDISGFTRGTIGVGYIRRNFKSGIYDDVDGISFEGRIEYFLSELTTFTLGARRVIEDSNITSNNAFFDNRLLLRADHELLRNLLLNVSLEAARQDYIGTPQRANVYRASGGARYMLSRSLSLTGALAYTRRSTRGTDLGDTFDEIRGQVGITYQR